MKKLTIIFSILLTALALAGCNTTAENDTNTNGILTESNQDELEKELTITDEVVYPHNEVIEVNIDISDENYQLLLDNAMEETYYTCNITYNGNTLENVAIRTKGNSSLRDVYNSGDDRFSYNIDLNYYEDQDLYGIDKLILNNLFMDPSMMAEYITYEALDALDAVSSRTAYVALSINEVYYGLYLSVEHVSNEFLDDNYGNSDNELYKPDSGIGANLNYITDENNYTGLIDKNDDDSDNEAIIAFMKQIESGEDLDEVFNVEGFLKYLAVSTFVVNLDSYQGGLFHNYYLYCDNGVFQWIAWDLNMAFNGFPGTQLTDEQATQFLIDEPVINSMNAYPLIETILANETYLEIYHTYLQDLVDGYFNEVTFSSRVSEIDALINTYVESDTNSFYTYEQYLDAVYTSSTTSYSILQFVEERTANIIDQLSGVIPSTNNGLGNITSQPGGRPPRR